MKNILLHGFALLFGVISISAQDLSIVFENTIGGNEDDWMDYVDQTTDGGYIVGCHSRSGISGDKTEAALGEADYWILKLNEDGELLWQKNIGGDQDERVRSLIQTVDGGYILGGYSFSGISGDKSEASQGGADYWVLKLDESGEIEWQNTIGGSGDDFIRGVYPTPDGGYIAGGYSNSDISGDKTENSLGIEDYWVVKLDASGAVEWDNTIGGDGEDTLYRMQVTSDGGFILGGHSDSNISGDKTENSQGFADYWLVKLDDLGTVVWENTIGGNSTDQLRDLQQTTDGGYILAGPSFSGISGDKTEAQIGAFDHWVIKVSDVGIIEWQNTVGGTSDEVAQAVSQLSDGGYIVTGFSNSDAGVDKTEDALGGYDYWVVKLEADGTVEWDNTLGGAEDDWFNTNVIQSSDDGIVFGGGSGSNMSEDKSEDSQGNLDVWIVKISGPPILGVPTESIKANGIVYPNPTYDEINVVLKDAVVIKMELSNALGRVIKTVKDSADRMDMAAFSSGVYFLTIYTERDRIVKKIIKL